MKKDLVYNRKKQMYQQIINVLSYYENEIKTKPFFNGSFEKLRALHVSIIQIHSQLHKPSLTLESKNNYRDELIREALQLYNILQIYAYDRKKKGLQKRLQKLGAEKMTTTTDLDLIRISRKLWLKANKYGKYSHLFLNKANTSSLANTIMTINKLEKNYGLTYNLISEIEKTSIKFIDALLHLRDEKKENKKLKKKYKNSFNEADNVIENMIDPFVNLFKSEAPTFYNAYLAAKTLKHDEIVLPEKFPETGNTEAEHTSSSGVENPVENANLPADSVKTDNDNAYTVGAEAASLDINETNPIRKTRQRNQQE